MAAATVREAETLLSGRLLRPSDLRKHDLEVWRLVGALGHGTWEELCAIAEEPRRAERSRWSAAMALLAVETLKAAVNETGLYRVQSSALVPLELALLGGEVGPPSSPLGTINLVRQVLQTPLAP